METHKSKYGTLHNNNYFLLSDEKSNDYTILEDITISIDGGIIDIIATITQNSDVSEVWFDKLNFERYDLEGRNILDITELKYKNIFHRLINKKSIRFKNDTRLKQKITHPYHLKSSTWSIKW